MSTFLDIVTAFGTVVAAISVITAFLLYKIQKRDEYLTKVRESLQLLSNNIEELDSILNFELAFELASLLVYSKSTQYRLQQVFNICNEAIKTKRKDEGVRKRIESELGVFGVSFQDSLMNKYTTLISEIKQASTIFYPNYKGLFRFSKACTTLMKNVFMLNKRLLLDEEVIARLVYSELKKQSDPWESFEQFQSALLDHFISLVEVGRIEHTQKDVNCLRKLVEIVYSSHIELTAKEWRNLSREGRKIILQPYDTISTVTGELREAEKCFRSVIDHESSMEYAALVQTIENANSKKD